MKWQGREGSRNIEDRRGSRGKLLAGGLGGGGLIVVIIIMLLGGDPSTLLNQLQQSSPTSQNSSATANDELRDFVSVCLKDNEDVWTLLFRERFHSEYPKPTMVLYSDATSSACGHASSATGPFYCPADEKIYLDLTFFQELKNRFKAPGDFAIAYVIAHEVGHHVQKQLGITQMVEDERAKLKPEEFNELSVRLELQADFYAGLWAHHAQQMKDILDPGDMEEALNAAHAIGDDRLQMEAQGYVVPDAFTHGSSEQRMRWFKKGFETGDIDQGDTFGEEIL